MIYIKAYKICSIDNFGYENDYNYTIKYSEAIKNFIKLVNKEIEEAKNYLISREEFYKEFYKFLEFPFNKEIINVEYPVIYYKDNEGFKANIYQFLPEDESKEVFFITAAVKKINIKE